MKRSFNTLANMKALFANVTKWSGNLTGLSAKRIEKRSIETRRLAAIERTKMRGKYTYRWDKHIVKANTKSEARARIKDKVKMKRLPTGANVVKI